MSRIVFLFCLACSLILHAADKQSWDFQYSFNLKKDKIATIFIDRRVDKGRNSGKYILQFRWTLYDGSKNLILLSKYMGYPNQYVLKRKRHLDRVRIKLLNSNKGYRDEAYAFIVFSDFDEKKRVASLNVYIKDNLKRIEVNFKPPKQ